MLKVNILDDTKDISQGPLLTVFCPPDPLIYTHIHFNTVSQYLPIPKVAVKGHENAHFHRSTIE